MNVRGYEQDQQVPTEGPQTEAFWWGLSRDVQPCILTMDDLSPLQTFFFFFWKIPFFYPSSKLAIWVNAMSTAWCCEGFRSRQWENLRLKSQEPALTHSLVHRSECSAAEVRVSHKWEHVGFQWKIINNQGPWERRRWEDLINVGFFSIFFLPHLGKCWLS